MKKSILPYLTFLLILSPLCAETLHETAILYSFFVPPKEWEMTDPKLLSPRVKIGFIKKKSGFSPTLNLATEKTDLSIQDYLKVVKKIHETERNNRWRHLGKMRTHSGEAHLTEIDIQSAVGPVRLLQLITIKEGTAYIVTAAAAKEEFPQFYKEFQDAFRSFTFTQDLTSAITDPERKNTLIKAQEQLLSSSSNEEREKNWPLFQSIVIKQFADLGAHWQTLILQSTREKMSTPLQEESSP